MDSALAEAYSLRMLTALGISEIDWQQTPPTVQAALTKLWEQIRLLRQQGASAQLELARLGAQVAALQSRTAKLAALELEVAALGERLGQNSRNSSQPPSADPPSRKPQTKRAPSGKKAGGQPGHLGVSRKLLPLAQVDRCVDVRPLSCGQCGSLLLGDDPQPARHQVRELPRVQPEVIEYRRHCLTCSHCGAANQADWPDGMPSGGLGPRAQAVIGYLTGRLGISQRDVVEVLATVHGLELSLGSIPAVQQQVSAALAQLVATAQAHAQQQAVHYVDETGWRQANQQHWLWIDATSEVTVFRVLPGRGQQQARTMLGSQFTGTVTTDRHRAYNHLAPAHRQLCWAHLKRDFQAFSERGGESARIGTALLEQVQIIFDLWHRQRAGELTRAEFQRLLAPVERCVREWLVTGQQCDHGKTAATCRDILKLEASLWTFVRVEGIEPTNNAAERPLRRAVLWRRRSFGTQSASGSQFVERILTVVTTLRQQGRDVLDYLTAACAAAQGQSRPCCLLPDTS